jgi:hypothetical protein
MFGRGRRLSNPDTPLNESLNILSKLPVARRVHRVPGAVVLNLWELAAHTAT